MTHTTHIDFLSEHQIRHPALTLRERMASQLKRYEDRLISLQEHDILHLLDLSTLQSSIHLADSWLQDLGDLDVQPKQDSTVGNVG